MLSQGSGVVITAIAVLFASMVACVREAGRYGQYQAVELKATIGWVEEQRALGRWDDPVV